MSYEEVKVLLGDPSTVMFLPLFHSDHYWREGPEQIVLRFYSLRVESKTYIEGTLWEKFKHQVWKRLPESWQ